MMRILAIDGNSIMNRAFYGIKVLSNSKGFATNAITGFMNIYLKEIQTLNPDCVAVAFDLHAPTFRHKAVSSYKANRKGMPPELREQMPVIKELLLALGVKVIEKEGFEADDILGTLSRVFSESDNECFILTGDRDSLQLVNSNTTVRLATTKETIVYDPEKINEVYGVEPKQLIEVKALMGDSSDNISGVPGIGEKTALKLIQDNKSVKELYENLETAEMTNSVRLKLESGKDLAFQSKWLATIVSDVPIENNPESYLLGEQDSEKIAELLSELEMFKLLEKLSIGAKPVNAQKSEEFNKPNKEYKACEWDESVFVNNSELSYFIFDGEKLSVIVGHNVFTTSEKANILKYLNSDIKKIVFDAKPGYKLCFENGTTLKNVEFCCDLAGYLLNSQSSEYTVENLCMAYHVSYLKNMDENSDICSIPDLHEKLKSEISKNEMDKLLYDIEQPLCEVLSSMEVYGVKADVNGIVAFGERLKEEIKKIESEIFSFSGREFNIASPKQLGTVLFEELGLPSKKKTKSGYSTNAEVLESLASVHPIVPLILEYRTLTKLNSTYVEGLLKVVGDDGRVRSVFKQTETRTGRISSTEPNMQNIPVRKELGREMRKFFVSENGNVLIDADYSQIELRVLASACDDENMKNAFLSGKDIHTSTASHVFNIPEDYVTPEMRSAAKAVNFGIIYGIGAFSLSKDIGVSVSEADKYIKQYFADFPNVKRFMDETVDGGMKNGYVKTIFGRRRYIPELSSSNKMLQAFGKRAAMNAPIQGAAADIIKIAMIKVFRKLRDEKIDARLILQVHDELIVESSLKDSERAMKILKEEMENAVNLSVPLTVDVNKGESWYIAKG